MTIFLISFGFLILLTFFRIVLPFIVMNRMVNMHVSFHEIYDAADFGMQSNHFFVTTEDGLRISAYEVKADNPAAVIICLSGIHNPSATIYAGHARLFRKNGYATIYFDMRAHGESDGDMICLGFREYLDTRAVVNYIKSLPEYNGVPIIAMGLSMGASTAIISAGEIPDIAGIVSLSAYSSWEDIFCDKMKAYSPGFFARMELPFVRFAANIKYGVNSKTINPIAAIQKLNCRPALLMHSREDSEVPFANFERLIRYAPPHVETFTREGNLHFIVKGKFYEPETDAEYTSILMGFFEKNFSRNRTISSSASCK